MGQAMKSTRALLVFVAVLGLVPLVARAGAEQQAVTPPPAAAKPAPAPGQTPAKPAATKPGKTGKPGTKAKPAAGAAGAAALPPAVLTGDGELICDINAKENGHQKLTIVDGGGLEFDVAVSPIVDGTVTTAGPDKGGSYRFTSHLARPAKAKLPGVGEFDLDELETKVIVEISRYKQPGGKGTALSFTSQDMARRGIYVEFAGRGHAKNGETYSFRVNLGAPTDGHGRVVPANDNDRSDVMAKVVRVRAPTTTVLVTTTLDRSGP
jgi:hypothetical protein